jgi:hypothetical protein
MSDPAAYTVEEFCKSNRISRTNLYELWKQGCGPAFMKNGVRRIISAESAAEWRRAMEARAAAEATAHPA